MKLSQINEAQYAQTLIKKGLGNLMKFFTKDDNGDAVYWHVNENFQVRNSKTSDNDEISYVEFSYDDDAEANDLLLVTYKDGDQDDMPKKEFAEVMIVFETRQVY